MAYTRKHTPNNRSSPPFTAITRHDICSHPTVQVLDIILDKEKWRVINYYHDVKDNTSLQALLNLDIEAITPTLIIGDFNTHAHNWSPPNVLQSHWSNRLEEWAVTNLLTLANNVGEITRRGVTAPRGHCSK
jgi:Endonuclease-reverse transcriptase